jgi:hypothetical protein
VSSWTGYFKDTTKMGYVLRDTDEALNDTIQLKKLLYQKKDWTAKKQFLIL